MHMFILSAEPSGKEHVPLSLNPGSASYGTQEKSCHFLESHFTHLSNGGKIRTHLQGLNELIYVKIYAKISSRQVTCP